MTVTLMHGFAGWITGLLAITGIGYIGSSAWEWIADRIEVGALSLPRRRWDRPGADVRLPDGRTARVLFLIDDSDAGDIANVQPHGEDEHQQPEWVATALLSPITQPEPKEA